MAAVRSRRKLSTTPGSFRVRKKRSFFSTTALTAVAPQPTKANELFKEPQPVSVFLPTTIDLGWYQPWLHGQLTNISHAVLQLQVGKETLLEGNAFEKVFAAVAQFARDNEGISIDDLIEDLRRTQGMEESHECLKAQRLLVFAILGWQSMLYRPTFNTCSLEELAVLEYDSQSNSGLVFDKTKVSVDLADRPLFAILKGFGNLLPSPPPNITQVASENSKSAATWLPLDPSETNAHLLMALLHVRIRWVDCLALHLDYNKSSRTLSLFSYPSFCVAMLQSKGTIFSFASTEKRSFDPRASEEDISQFMREVLLSFRLLFGQHGPSRKLFPHTYRPADPSQNLDQLLPILCMKKSVQQPSVSLSLPADQPVYFAAQHFPVLSERIELVAKELKNSRPASMRELLHDRRDKLQYWTFWLISIIGGISVLLSLIQVILQAIQLARG
ncbi:uncharacterized protein BDR25DRAFT_264460 [Lindgomyces ingoldianus]|uniref:Uncharacterized protein n=1 Tax=Lindgomyces ingoldianus TaxID=673940 RepID=A0ACB6QQ11_9PLEO|nr:uncharacterized protein BDR25DRAFT_264460 [Lindgomyces ingoldianus]KAF2468653.1 hypothetical protein BDR25DRAFT_264460 [Lindgomyces ingoldianus]